LPQIGVDTVVASSVAVTTQVNALWSPLRSLMISGRDVLTTVDAIIDTNIPRRRPERAWRTCRCVMPDSERFCGGFGARGKGTSFVDSGQLYLVG
jgi:hypothetical protein